MKLATPETVIADVGHDAPNVKGCSLITFVVFVSVERTVVRYAVGLIMSVPAFNVAPETVPSAVTFVVAYKFVVFKFPVTV